MTRSVGLKGQGGPGVSETRGGARGVIDRRHEAPPRVTGKPSATLRLRHPGAPAPDKKDPHQLVFASLLSRAVVGGKFCVWRPACGRHVAFGGRIDPRSSIRASACRARSRGSPLSQVCHVHNGKFLIVTTERNAQGRTPLGTGPSSSGKRNTVLVATLPERGFFSFVEATSQARGGCE